MSKRLVAIGLLGLALGYAKSAAAAEQPIDDFESSGAPAPWTFSNGSEFPGATGSLTLGTGHSGNGAHLAFDFSAGGKYVSASRSFATPISAAAIALWVRAAPGIHITLRVTDSGDQTLQYRTTRPLEATDPAAWYRDVVALGTTPDHWGGADDGVVHLPLKSMSVLAADPIDPKMVGAVDLDDVVSIDSLDNVSIDPAKNQLLPGPNAPDLASRIGVNIHFTKDDQALDIARDAGFTWVRMDLSWAGIEQTKGSYDFSNFDGLVSALATRGMKLHLILDYMNPLYPAAGTSGFLTTTVPAFAAVTQAATAHFAGKGVTYEVWNEPNLDGFWPPAANADEYAALSKAAISAAHQGDPNAKVSTAGIAGFDIAYLRTYLKAGGGQGADAIGVHPYRQGGGESVLEDLLFMRTVIAEVLPASTPVWSTEWGYSSAWYGGDGHTVSARATQAKFAARELLSGWAIGFPQIIYYDIRDDGTDPTDKEHNFGLIQNDYQDKPAAVAVRTLTQAAKDRSFVGFLSTPSPTLHAMRLDGANDSVVALWSSGASVDVPILVPSTATGIDLLGAPLTMTPIGSELGFTLRETDGPVYLTFPKAPIPDAGSDAGSGGNGGSDASSTGGSTAKGGSGGSGGSAKPKSSDSGDSSGCGCRVAPSKGWPEWAGALMLLGAIRLTHRLLRSRPVRENRVGLPSSRGLGTHCLPRARTVASEFRAVAIHREGGHANSSGLRRPLRDWDLRRPVRRK